MSEASIAKWAGRLTRGHDHITPASDCSKSWGNGLSFCALLYTWFPEKIDIKKLNADSRDNILKNFTIAFKVAEEAGVDKLLDEEDTIDVQDVKSISVYLSLIYEKCNNLPVKFSASPEWIRKFEEAEKAKKLLELKQKMEADRAASDLLRSPQAAVGKVGDLQARMAAKREEEELQDKLDKEKLSQNRIKEPSFDAEEMKKAREEAMKKIAEKKAADELKAKQKKEEDDEKKRKQQELLEQRQKEMAASGTTVGKVLPGSVDYSTTGKGAAGGPSGKLIIFTCNITVSGMKPNSDKTDLIVHIDGPSGVQVRVNVMGGPGGAFIIGITPDQPGQHWLDFVYKGVWTPKPFCLNVQNNFGKTPEFPYTGKLRKEAEEKGSDNSEAEAAAEKAAAEKAAAEKAAAEKAAAEKAYKASAEKAAAEKAAAEKAAAEKAAADKAASEKAAADKAASEKAASEKAAANKAASDKAASEKAAAEKAAADKAASERAAAEKAAAEKAEKDYKAASEKAAAEKAAAEKAAAEKAAAEKASSENAELRAAQEEADRAAAEIEALEAEAEALAREVELINQQTETLNSGLYPESEPEPEEQKTAKFSQLTSITFTFNTFTSRAEELNTGGNSSGHSVISNGVDVSSTLVDNQNGSYSFTHNVSDNVNNVDVKFLGTSVSGFPLHFTRKSLTQDVSVAKDKIVEPKITSSVPITSPGSVTRPKSNLAAMWENKSKAK